MAPSVRVLYPDGGIQFQQDISSIHDSRVVQEWLSRQADVELIDWPPRAPDMNPIENMWSEVKKPRRKPGLTSLREIEMLFGPCVRRLG
jgi:transposase